MKLKYLYALLLGTLIYSCDDATSGIGDSTIAAGDSIPAGAATYNVITRSILADSVYAMPKGWRRSQRRATDL